MSSPHVLVCGGAGYIGSHLCKALAAQGFVPVTFDNLVTGHREAVRWGPLVEGDLLDPAALQAVFSGWPVQAVMHFAARSLVAESVRDPELYFRTNVQGTLNLLAAMRAAGVQRLVFSSTAAVYGNPDYVPIDEAHRTLPINPYGESKLMAEREIAGYCRDHGLRAACLRYFNAAGADPDGDIGESHEPETHLIPIVLRSALSSGPGESFTIFGDDYETTDGTCIRDYVHVTDLCEAHLLALSRLESTPGLQVFNLGTGQGHSVAEVLEVCREVSGLEIPARYVPRRPGDPAVLVASADEARNILGWQPRYGLRDCVAHALAWERSHSKQ